MRYILYLSLTFLFLGCAEKTPPVRQYRFYDFDVVVTVRNPVGGIQEKYILANLHPEDRDVNSSLTPRSRLDSATLYLVKYATSSNRQKRLRKIAEPRDTTRIRLRAGQMDTLYALTAGLFALPGPQNLSPDSVPKPTPVRDDDLSAAVEFNLGPRGNRYKALVPQAAHNFALHTYLRRVVALHRRSHPPIT